MIKSLYVDNYKSLKDFRIDFQPGCTLLIGANGSGKTAIGEAFSILHGLAENGEVYEVISEGMLPRFDLLRPFVLEVTATYLGYEFTYRIEIDCENASVTLEQLIVSQGEQGSTTVFSRQHGQITKSPFPGAPTAVGSKKAYIGHIAEAQIQSPVFAAKVCFSGLVVLGPGSPETGEPTSSDRTLEEPRYQTEFDLLLERVLLPSSLSESVPGRTNADVEKLVGSFVSHFLPHISELNLRKKSLSRRELRVIAAGVRESLPLSALSDGEKSIIQAGLVRSLLRYEPQSTVFWDEPDNFLSYTEIQQFIRAIRPRGPAIESQLILTSHNPETILTIPEECITLIFRSSGYSSSQCVSLAEAGVGEDTIRMLDINGMRPAI